MRRFITLVYESLPVQVAFTLVMYGLYAAMIGVCLVPSALVLHGAARALLAQPPAGMALLARLLLFCLSAAASLYVYFITGIIVMGALVRLATLGMRPGRYPMLSATTARWLLSSGISLIVQKTILPLIPVTFFSNLYFRLVGLRMGRGVRLNSWFLNDPWLIELGDGVVVGGGADFSPHQFEDNHLILEPIRVGSGTLIGAHCYISSAVTIGSNCLIGIRSYLRRGTRVPDGTRMTSLAGLPLRDMYRVEKAPRIGRRKTPRPARAAAVGRGARTRKGGRP
jgi:acetyltransferase-like isoleucine patch superfamily enzyme